MRLDDFDRHVLEQSGEARDILNDLYGLSVGKSNSVKYLTGIRHHLEHKRKITAKERQIGDMEEVVIKADGSQTTTRLLLLSEEDKKPPARLRDLMGYDPLQWELISSKTTRRSYDVTIKNAASEAEKHTNHAYMVTVTVKPLQNKIATDTVRQTLQDIELPPIEEYTYKQGNHWLELPISDLHLAKLANGYGLELAKQLYRRTFLDILSRIEQYRLNIDWITFPIGNDFFHVDTAHETTTAGTKMETSASWPAMYKCGVELLIWTVEQLRPMAPVHLDYVPGNHDEVMSYCAAVSLETKYADVPGITFNTSADPENQRKYNTYGYNLVGLAHGHEEGKRIERLMQDEVPELWGESKFREWHLGHLHIEELKSFGTLKIRRIPSITAIDSWHGKKGFIANRMAQAFVWDKDTGLDTIINSNVVIQ